MDFDAHLLAFAAVVLFAFATEAATGFGSIVIALSFGVHLYPIHALLPVLVLLDILLTASMAYRHHDTIAHGWLLRRILPLMGLGLIAGVLAFHRAPAGWLRVGFGGFVVLVALRELAREWRTRGTADPLPWPAQVAGLFGAGVLHGLFASGGPLLVYVLGRSGLNKGSFRSTLIVVWLVLNLALVAVYATTGRLHRGMVPALVLLVPPVLLAIPLGEWAHQRLDEQRFRILVFAVLAAVGVSIVL